ncbi:MAG: SpoVR family protein [Deltaproteobacteria bacterium]|nr:SpoVR family protein [Deltaproteobacteria bacterium]
MVKFPTPLKEIKYEIQQYADDFGLDYYDIIFEVLDYEKLNEVAAYGGFPARYPHWRFGMEYEHLSRTYTYGLSKIYEMVINNDPCYAYLLECNNPVDQKIVMAHVYGHCDFFKNNLWFAKTNRKMMDEMANHGARITRHADRHGMDRIEAFIDRCLSIEDLIDMHLPFIKRKDDEVREMRPGLKFESEDQPGHDGCGCGCGQGGEHACSAHASCPGAAGNPDMADEFAEDFMDDEEQSDVHPSKLRSKDYMDEYINPPEFWKEHERKIRDKLKGKKKFPEEPQKDVLLFLLDHAPLNYWQRDILSAIREEAYYYAPQGQTKIMNEGWATFWHSTIMTQKALKASELVDYADHHSGTLGGSRTRLNPYKLGVELFRDIEERWDKGRFGKEYEECEDLALRRDWDLNLKLGRKKIFEVRQVCNDINFIDTYLTEEFCHRHKLFMYQYDTRTKQYVITSRKFKDVKEAILSSLTNFGRPLIYVEDGNYHNRGELLLSHRYEGRILDPVYARDTLVNIQYLWKRPVHIQTMDDDRKLIFSFDGEHHSDKRE